VSPSGPPATRSEEEAGERSRVPRLLPATSGLLAEEGFKAGLIAVVSTVLFFGIAAWLIFTSPNWPDVRDQFFNPDDFRASWPDVTDGFKLNLEMWFYCMLVIPVVALAVAVMRSLRGPAFFPLRLLAVLFTDIFRGIPLILLILLLGFGLPALQIEILPNSAMFWGITALTLSYAAYTAEIYRSGIDAVPESQRSSARAVGLTQWQAMRFAILPQAVRNVVPALMNTVVSLQKDVALVSILGIREAVREAQIYTSRTFNYTSYIVATILFLAISIPLTRLVDWYTSRDRALRSQAQV
jgi:polar amino acid transport system permease protein